MLFFKKKNTFSACLIQLQLLMKHNLTYEGNMNLNLSKYCCTRDSNTGFSGPQTSQEKKKKIILENCCIYF